MREPQGELEFGRLMVSEAVLDLLTDKIAEQLKISPEFMDYLADRIAEQLKESLGASLAEKVAETLQERLQGGFTSTHEGVFMPKLLLSGHKALVPRLNGFQPVAEKVAQFSKLEEASEDVATYRLNRLSLWKAAELGLSPDEVIEVLKVHGRTPPKRSLKNWISRTMSAYGALHIVREDNYNVLEAVDEDALTRVLAYREVRGAIFRQLTPTRARIVQGRRADLKRFLLEKGFPVKDYGLMDEFKPLEIEWKPEAPPLWEHQKEAVKRFISAWNGVIILPPGSGKTRIAVAATVELKAPTLILTNKAQICEQIRREYLENTTIKPQDIGVFHGGSKDRNVRPITIATYQMATRPGSSRQSRLVKDIWKTKWGLIVFDEIQHIPAAIWRRTAEDLQARRKLGLTATPVREDKKEREIFSLVGPPLMDVNWLEMADEGRIADVTAYEVLVGMSQSTRKAYNGARAEFDKILTATTNPEKTRIVKQLLEKHRNDPTLIIGYYVEQAVKLADTLGVEIVYGATPQKQREKLYQGFREGAINRLVLTSVGEEGIDLPNARVAISVASLYGSRMGFSQRFGRILRPKEETAVFYELVTEGTVEQDFSERRRAYLVSQGYDFDTMDFTGVS